MHVCYRRFQFRWNIRDPLSVLRVHAFHDVRCLNFTVWAYRHVLYRECQLNQVLECKPASGKLFSMNKSWSHNQKYLNVGQGTAHRIVSHFVATWKCKSICKKGNCFQKLCKGNQLFVIGLILNNPCTYLGEVCHEINQGLGINVSVAMVCKLLRDCGITQNKISQVVSQQCCALRGAFLNQCFLLDPAMFG